MDSSGSHRVEKLRRTVAAVLVAAAGAAMVLAALGGGFLADRIIGRTVAGGVLLCAVGLASAFGRDTSHDCGHHTHVAVLRVWPILLPFFLLPAALDGSTFEIARSKVLVEPAREVPDYLMKQPPQAVVDVAEADFTDFLSAAYADPTQLHGRRVRITGFVHQPSGWPLDRFLVARLAVWCCLADANLVGIPARVADGGIPPTGAWIQVEGVGHAEHDPPTVTGGSSPVVSNGRGASGEPSATGRPVLTLTRWRTVDPPSPQFVTWR